MTLAQIQAAEKAFTETAQTFGLAVGILIAVIVALAFVLWIVARTAVKWFKPLIEQFFEAHLLTMKTVRETVGTQADSMSRLDKNSAELVTLQKHVATVLEGTTKDQGNKLDNLTKATDRTNQILTTNGACQVEAVKKLIDELHIKLLPSPRKS